MFQIQMKAFFCFYSILRSALKTLRHIYFNDLRNTIQCTWDMYIRFYLFSEVLRLLQVTTVTVVTKTYPYQTFPVPRDYIRLT